MSDIAITQLTQTDGGAQALSNSEPTPTSIVPLGDSQRIGRVASPPRREATSEQFHFWVNRNQLVEKTQIIRTESSVGGRSIQFYAIVDEVYRQSRKRDIGEEFDNFDGDVDYEPEFRAEGVTFATASVLRAEPPVLTPPLEQSPVFLGSDAEARIAYGVDEVRNPLRIGLIKNGADAVAGPGVIDLDYLLGVNGGHLNVNGVAGRGSKSSFLLFVIQMLLRDARRRARERPSDPNPLMVVPIILNVKGFDLFFIDRQNREYDPQQHLGVWQALGVDDPEQFENVAFYAPQVPGGSIAIPTGRTDDVQPYSWSLGDVIERGLLLYLFADEDTSDENFSALVRDIEAYLTDDQTTNDGANTRRLRRGDGRPQTFQDLLDWITADATKSTLPGHHSGTWAKLRRRVLKLVLEGAGVLRRNDQNGNPLNLAARETRDPVVVDLYSLARIPSLQRFVVATIFRQLVDERTGAAAVPGLVYLVALDELNRFAPRGGRDPITQLIEVVAAEMRSQGIILLGAQQQASKVSEKVVENAGIRVLGRSGSLELDQLVWSFLSQSARRKAASLAIDEKMIVQDNFREPMHVRVPFPAWAMRRDNATVDFSDFGSRSQSNQDEIATY